MTSHAALTLLVDASERAHAWSVLTDIGCGSAEVTAEEPTDGPPCLDLRTRADDSSARPADLVALEVHNAAWRADAVRDGTAGAALLDSFAVERDLAREQTSADEGETTAGRRWFRRGRTVDPVPPAATVYRGSPVVQPGCGAYAPELPVITVPTSSGDDLGSIPHTPPAPVPLSSLRHGPFVVVAIGPTRNEATELATSVAAEIDHARAAGADPALPRFRLVAGAAADATGDTDTAGAALGNLLVVRPDGRLAWKVNGEPAPDEVAAVLLDALARANGG